MKKLQRASTITLTGLSALALTTLNAMAHPGTHVGADHSHGFGGGELAILVSLALVGAMLLYNRKR